MADAFPLSGNVDPRTFPFAIMDLYRSGATGSLKVEGPTYHKALYFRSGRMLFGSSNDPRDQLGAILIESGKLTPEQLEDVNGKVGPGNPLAKLLAESGLVSQRELGDAARTKVERIVSDLLNYESGSYEFEDGVLPKGAVDLKLSTERTAITAVRRIDDRAFVLRHIDSLQTVLSPTADLAAGAEALEDALGSLPECIDGERTLKEVAGAAGMDDFETAKLACALLFLGWVRVGGSLGASVGQVEPEIEPEIVADDEAPIFVSADAGSEIDLGAAAERGFDSGVDPALVIASPDDDATVAIPTPSFDAETPEGHGAFVPAEEETEVADDELAPEFLPQAEEEAPAMSFAAGELAEETQQDFGEPDDDLPSTGVFDQTYSPTMPSAKAYTGASEIPTEIGLSMPPRPIQETPGPPSPPTPAEPETGSMPPQKRPSKEDLAALDALLNSRSLDGGLEPGRPDESEWSPQFLPGRPGAGAGAGAGGARTRSGFGNPAATGRGRRESDTSWVQTVTPIALGLGVVVIAAGLAVWSLGGPGAVMAKLGIRSADPQAAPAPPTLPPTTSPPSTTLVAEGETPTSPGETPSADGDEGPDSASPAPEAAETPAPAPPSTTLSAVPTAPATTVPPATTPPAPVSAGGLDGARAALRAGDFGRAAAGFAAGLRSAGDYSVQVLVACSADTVAKAVREVDAPELFIVPVDLQGRACYRICWGMYASDAEARAGAASVPAYFRTGGGVPRVVRTSEILR